ncbi:MAG: hypothetical protein JWQ35_689 [Bacteriovoracaceae bacterium]|nr:hypothetical protein [Bacteriovoracaceae bacterium]
MGVGVGLEAETGALVVADADEVLLEPVVEFASFAAIGTDASE